MRSRRLTLAAMALTGAAFLCTGPFPRTDGAAVTNEGYSVNLLNPTNGLPPGWTWGTTSTTASPAILSEPRPTCFEDEPCWDCSTMGNRICGATEPTEPPVQLAPAVRLTREAPRIASKPLIRTAGESDCGNGTWAPEGYC